MPDTLLLTGFEPYGGHALNPAARLVAALDGERIGGLTVAGRLLPVVFDGLAERIAACLDTVAPTAVVALGLAPGEAAIRLERFAVNLADADIPDNGGAQPKDRALLPGGPVAYAATLPLRAIERALRAAAIPVRLSTSAGTYVCNAAFYQACALIERRGGGLPCGFIHLPYLPEQAPAGAPSLDFATMERAIRLALTAIGNPA